jgi:hypothetical protein
VVGVAGGATRMVLTQHQARANNHADVAAKDGSQETAVNLAALLAGLVLLPAVHGDPVRVWGTYLSATTAHIYCNYRAVKAVVLETLDAQRAHLLAEALREGQRHRADDAALLTPARIAAQERLLARPPPVVLGCSVAEVASTADAWRALVRVWARRPYVVAPRAGPGPRVGVVLHPDADDSDIAEALVAAHLVLLAPSSPPLASGLVAAAQTVGRRRGDLAARLIACGWDLRTIAEPVGPWRATWAW